LRLEQCAMKVASTVLRGLSLKQFRDGYSTVSDLDALKSAVEHQAHNIEILKNN